MTRRVNDVDFRVVKKQRRILGKDSDASLAFQIIRIHHALDDSFVGTKNAALPKHGIHQRGFAVVHVGNDGDIAYFVIHDSAFVFFQV